MPETRADIAQKKVLQVTWDWRAASVPGATALAGLRRSAVLQAVVMGVVAALLLYVLHHQLAGRIVAVLAVVVLFLGLAAPAAYKPIHGFGQWLGRAVGTLLVYVLLVPFFFLFFVPVSLLLRLQGRDPLHRKFRAVRWTYWISRRAHPRGYNISKQFLHEDRTARGARREVGCLPERDPEERS